jgi:HprK-related kinase A
VILADISAVAARRQLRRGTLTLRIGPFVVRFRTPLADVAAEIYRLYCHHPLDDGGFCDYHIAVVAPFGIRRWLRPQSLFLLDGRAPFKPLPRSQAVPVLEWGLNWCVASQAHQYLILHAAVIERNGYAVILPGDPGSGKSTLCAALIHRGWRLLSDELALIDRHSGQVYGLARPVSLKNESIDVIGRWASDSVFSARYTDTVKGTIALLKPPAQAVARINEPALPAWVITPEFARGVAPTLEPNTPATTFMELAHNGFNYSIHGSSGFDALSALVDRCSCLHFRYSRLEDAVATFDSLPPPNHQWA